MIVGFILSPFSPRLSQLHINGAKMTGILLTTLGVLILYFSLYSKGIRTGSWGLAISLGVMTASFIFMDWVVKCFGLKPVVVTVQYLCVISLFGMTVLTSVPSVLILVSFSGPYLGIILTVPYILISVYKVRHLIM